MSNFLALVNEIFASHDPEQLQEYYLSFQDAPDWEEWAREEYETLCCLFGGSLSGVVSVSNDGDEEEDFMRLWNELQAFECVETVERGEKADFDFIDRFEVEGKTFLIAAFGQGFSSILTRS